MQRILIIDDNEVFSRGISLALSGEYEVFTASHREAAIPLLHEHVIDLILLDLHLPPQLDSVEEGMLLLNKLKELSPQSVTIIMTGDRDKATAIEAIERGAYDFFQKPINITELMIIIRRALKKRELESENLYLRQQLAGACYPKNIIGVSETLRQLLEKVERIASSQASVLILGESGTGKELIARALHYLSDRRERPFIEVNCSAFPETLLESELFGHEKGAFTGAIARRPGRFELAHRGTLFLDEIGDVSESIQVKLLRVLQERKFQRLGGKTLLTSDFRLITSTNKDIQKKIENGSFREDFFFRLNVIQLMVPPLRDRRDDIPALIDYFIARFNKVNNRTIKGCSKEVLDFLTNYHLPGNVRELENIIEASVVLAAGPDIELADLPPYLEISVTRNRQTPRAQIVRGLSFNEAIARFERDLLTQSLEEHDYNKSLAAQHLGLTREQVKYLCRKHGVNRR